MESHGSFQEGITCVWNGAKRCFDFVYMLVIQLYGVIQNGLQLLAIHSFEIQSAVIISKIVVVLLGSALVGKVWLCSFNVFYGAVCWLVWLPVSVATMAVQISTTLVNTVFYMLYMALIFIGKVLWFCFNVVYWGLVLFVLIVIAGCAVKLVEIWKKKSGNLPSHWSSMSDGVQYIREKLWPFTVEYEDVKTLFKNSICEKVSVLSIERVQNSFIWEKYYRKKENMATAKTRGGENIAANEKRLFHGTSPDAVEAICKQNFDWRLHGKNATVYGEGSYFAANASYSHRYARGDLDSCQYMFLANVLVGSYTQGHSGLRRPPAINPFNPESDLYDSCVNDTNDPTIFVVFDTDQFYPAYVIKYSVVSHAASTQNSEKSCSIM